MNDFNRLLEFVMKQARDVGIPYSGNIDPNVVINKRAKSRFGMCSLKDGVYTIELSSMLLDAPERSCCQTLAHELIHTCKGCNNHGALFMSYAQRMNLKYGYDIRRAHTPDEMGIEASSVKRPVNYILVCRKCGQQIERSRFSPLIAHPSDYRCRCGGTLKRIK